MAHWQAKGHIGRRQGKTKPGTLYANLLSLVYNFSYGTWLDIARKLPSRVVTEYFLVDECDRVLGFGIFQEDPFPFLVHVDFGGDDGCADEDGFGLETGKRWKF